MKNLLKILIGIAIIFVLLGSATAFEIDDFKVPDYFGDLNGGQSINQIDSSIQFYIYETEDGDFDSDADFDVTPLENNTYKIYDKILKTTGIQEKVNVDDTDYTIYLSGNTDLENLQGYLKQFNELNNLEPVEI